MPRSRPKRSSAVARVRRSARRSGKTSKPIARIAGRLMHSKNKAVRKVAASALGQRR